PADGGRLLDYWMGHGALLLGHNFPPVVEALRRHAERGLPAGACHELEVRWAELVRALVPGAERVRFTASASEATQLALRVARAYTDRPTVLLFTENEHGWHDEALAHSDPMAAGGLNPGALANVVRLPLDRPEP